MLIKTFLLNQLKFKHAFAFVLSLLLCSASFGQLSGVVTDAETGEPLIGATVLVKGATSGTITDIDGSYSLAANNGDVVTFSYTGYTSQDLIVGESSRLDVMLSSGVLVDEIVVTGYAVQRKRDITGAVSVIKSDELNEISATSFTQKLEGRAAGLTTSSSGQPGEGTTVRIRGIGSFQNNDPLYVIDGVPVTDQYNTGFNPNDIETIQVLKDASAASIYGSRANNGVIIITTKKGKAGKTTVTYSGYAGISTPIAKTDYLITDPQDWSTYVWDAHENAGITVAEGTPYGGGRGVLPTYSFPVTNSIDEETYSYPDNIIMKANQSGTDWFDEIFAPALTHEHNIGVSGGTDNAKYYISGSYLDQQGTLKHNFFERFGLRANSSFTKGKFTFGENLSLTRSQSVGNDGIGGGNQDEQGVVAQLSKINPLTPVYDVGGNYGGDKANGVSNGQNPVATLDRSKDNVGTFYRVLGNLYGEVGVTDNITVKSSIGIDYFNNFTQGFTFPTFEEREFTANNGFSENWSNGFNYTFTNTARYNNNFKDVHEFQVLVGQEAVKNQGRNIGGGLSNYFTDNINAWYLQTGLAAPDSRTVSSSGGASTLLSYFGKVDYAYDDKYLVSATLRRDASSNFGPEFQWGTFPAISVGWRVSNESFLADNATISDLKLRFGYGVTGNQSIPGGNTVNRFGGGTGNSFYDINGANGSVVTGYSLTNRGNPLSKWEENVSTNIGLDLALWDNKLNLVVDVYNRTTKDLLYPALLPGTAGTAAAAFVNIGEMKNSGVDLGLNYNGRINSDMTWDAGLTFTTYKNEITNIDGSSTSFFNSGGLDSRIGTIAINPLNGSISSFYGLTADGIFKSQAEVDAHADQAGKGIGKLRFADINGFNEDGTLSGTPDGVINDADLGVIGDPHPDFTAGLNLGAKYKNFDLNVFLFGASGNQVFNYQKVFEVFGLFNSNVRKDVLTRSWSPSNPDGDWPQLNINDTDSQQPSSFYVEDASYLRLKNIQLGYTFPSGNNVFSSMRVYIQGQNLFTLTGYEGLDPAPSNFGVQNGGDSDNLNGFDFGNYPANKTVMIGVNASF